MTGSSDIPQFIVLMDNGLVTLAQMQVMGTANRPSMQNDSHVHYKTVAAMTIPITGGLNDGYEVAQRLCRWLNLGVETCQKDNHK